MVRHIPIVAGLHAAMGAFQLLVAVAIGGLFLLLGGGVGMLGLAEGEEMLLAFGAIYGTAGALAGLASAVMAVPSFVAAWGMYTRQAWGRILGMIVSVLAMASVPVGTMVGIYTLVVLLDRDVAAAFQGRA